MNFNEYQKLAKRFEYHSSSKERRLFGRPLVNATLGLVGEAGEFADKIKKLYRDRGGRLDAVSTQDLIHELGDMFWYIAKAARELGVTLNDVARMNIRKLASRKRRGTLGGDGDHR